MRAKTTIITAVVLTLIAVACGGPHYFLAHDFSQRTVNHKTVAVMPVEMIMTGTKPKKLTEEDIKKIEEGESLAFQMSLYNSLLRNANLRKQGVVTVSFQPYEKTRDILKNANVGVRDSWSLDPQKLCTMLGVDAVVKTRVQKQRYMSDLASYGINLGVNVLDALGGIGAGVMLPGIAAGKTSDIDAQCSLFNSNDGYLLWKDMYKAGADWSRPANAVIDDLTNAFGRNFPYRQKPVR